MRLANAWGAAFAFALVVHIAGLALAGQGFMQIDLKPKIEYLEVELAPVAPPPVKKQVQTEDVPVKAVSQRENLINNSKRVKASNMPAAAGLAGVVEQNNSLTGVATVSEGGQVESTNGSGFSATAGSGEVGTGGAGNSDEGSGVASAQPRVKQEIDHGPSVAYKASPEYPSTARRNRWQGVVYISVLIESSGNVAAVRVAESSGYDVLDQAAADVVLNKWRFNPAYRDGQPVAARVRVPVSFSLDS